LARGTVSLSSKSLDIFEESVGGVLAGTEYKIDLVLRATCNKASLSLIRKARGVYSNDWKGIKLRGWLVWMVQVLEREIVKAHIERVSEKYVVLKVGGMTVLNDLEGTLVLLFMGICRRS
jgi:hypothetical protein